MYRYTDACYIRCPLLQLHGGRPSAKAFILPSISLRLTPAQCSKNGALYSWYNLVQAHRDTQQMRAGVRSSMSSR
jgi:hypothetical protein